MWNYGAYKDKLWYLSCKKYLKKFLIVESDSK